jgi:riboflavin synthase
VFTGLIEDVGRIEAVETNDAGATIRIATRLGAEVASGDSVAVDGVCLTATEADEAGFSAEAMNQTLRVTALGGLEAGGRVNLELALKATDRLGGHILQGHVDGVGEVLSSEEDGFARRLRLRIGQDLMRYVVARGSVALAGVSLTVSDLGEDWLEVSLIPETLERTNLDELGEGAQVNVECDVVAKYVEKLVSPFAGKENA